MMDVIKGLIRLVKEDNESGKGVLGILNGDMEGLDRDWYDGSRGIGWCMYYELVMGENGKGEKVLEIWYEERSWEFVSEFGNDVQVGWRVMEYVGKEVGVKGGYLYERIE